MKPDIDRAKLSRFDKRIRRRSQRQKENLAARISAYRAYVNSEPEECPCALCRA